MIGRLENVAFLGAVATASTLFDVLFWGIGFLRMGTTSLVAQYHGAGDRRACVETLYRALILALVLACLVLALRDWFPPLGFRLAGGSDEVQLWAQAYFAVRVLSTPMVLSIFALNGFFLGVGNALAPLCVTVVAGIVNVVGNYALIFGAWGVPAHGVIGAAWASVLANTVGLGVGLTILLVKYRHFIVAPSRRLLDSGPLRHLAGTNLNLFGRTLCLLFAQFSMLAMVSRLGDIPLAAHAVLWQVWLLVSFGVDGFAHAAEVLVGNMLGARDFTGARQLARRTLIWGLWIGGIFGVVYAFWLVPIGALFTRDASVLAAIGSVTLMIALVQPINAMAFVFDGILIGANDVAYLFGSMLVAAFGVFLPLALAAHFLDMGFRGVWLAYDGLMLGRFSTLLLRYRGDRWLRTFVRS
jgi:MATE family multidrug resistance protein